MVVKTMGDPELAGNNDTDTDEDNDELYGVVMALWHYRPGGAKRTFCLWLGGRLHSKFQGGPGDGSDR